MVDALIEAGADVNAKDIRGMTPLMLGVASETQDAAIVRRLVHAGADVNAKSTAGESSARLGEEVRRSRCDLDPHGGGRARPREVCGAQASGRRSENGGSGGR